MKKLFSPKHRLAGLAAALTILLTAPVVHADYKSTVLADSPAGYWRLDDATSTAINSGSQGAAGNGTYSGTYTLNVPGALVGDSDGAVGIDGVSGEVVVPYNAAFNSNAFTIETWAKAPALASGNYAVLNARVTSPTEGYTFYLLKSTSTNAQWAFWTGNGSGWNAQQPPAVSTSSAGQWTHLVGTYDGTNQSFYINGALCSKGTYKFVANPSSLLRIGAGGSAGSPAYFFQSNVDEVAIYGYALSPSQVINHYVAAVGSNPPPVAPAIGTAPKNITNYVGVASTFTVTETGTFPFTNQWVFLGTNTAVSSTTATNIPNATNSTYGIASTALTNAGNYAVIISNNGGAVTSAVVALTVIDIQSPTIAPEPNDLETIYTGGTANFVAGATGGGNIGYQWSFNGTKILYATNATLVVTNVQAVNQGNYQLQVTNQAGTNLSDLVTLTVLTAPATNTYAGHVMMDKAVAYWRLDESSPAVAYDRAGGFNGNYAYGTELGTTGAITGDSDTAATFTGVSSYVDVPFSSTINSPHYTLEFWALDNGTVTDNYRCPIISRQDTPQQGFTFYGYDNNWQFWAGTGAGWSVLTASTVPIQYNSWMHLVITYDGTNEDFYVNGSLAASSKVSYLPNPAQDLFIGQGDNGSYPFFGNIDEVAVYNTALSASQVSTHYTVGLGETTPVSIVVPPASGTALVGSNLTFSVTASGSLPISYQWQLGGANLVNQTNTTLTISNVAAGSSAPYQVIVSNPSDSVTSSVVIVTGVTLTNSYASVVLADGATGYWRLDEPNGSSTAANSGSLGATADGAYNSVTYGVPGAIAGDPDTAAGFTASEGSTVDVPYAPQLNNPEFTAECWAQMTGAGNSGDEGYQSPLTSRGSDAGYIFYGYYGGNWQFWTGSGGAYNEIIGPLIQVGTWTHLAATYDGTTARFYVNGVDVGDSATTFLPNSANVLRIGGGKSETTPGAYFFQGNVDEVAVYANALSPASIQAHYQIGAIGAVGAPTVSIQETAAGVVVTWSGGTLQAAGDLSGTWTNVSGASPMNLGTTPVGTMFFRVQK